VHFHLERLEERALLDGDLFVTRLTPLGLAGHPFDRLDWREVAHKELAEGTYTIGIDPQTRLLELFPGPAAANASPPPTTNRAAAVPASTAAPTTVPASVVPPTSTAMPKSSQSAPDLP
jgi:hypothetical protein